MEDLLAALDWVLMINPTAATNEKKIMSVGMKRKCADDVDDPNNEPILTPPMPLTPSQPSTSSIMCIASTTTIPTKPCQFPALSSVSPNVLQRGKRVVKGVDLDL
jgi:hypothetical protein